MPVIVAAPTKRSARSLGQLTPRELEAFVQQVAARVSRATLQHVVAHLRSFLRWLAARGAARQGLDSQIDTPRVYRQEQLPRALRWDTVRALLETRLAPQPFSKGRVTAVSLGRALSSSCHRNGPSDRRHQERHNGRLREAECCALEGRD